MDGGRLLRKLAPSLLIVALIAISLSVPTAAFGCDGGEILQGCVEDDHVDLEGTGGGNNPGTGGSGGGNDGGGSSGGGGSAGGGNEDDACDLRECFDVENPPTPEREVTWRDIASFRPTPEVDHMQPNGWMVVGLDTNFYATGGVRIVNGELLGYPAAVRFTPVRWHWTYGDGTAATKATRGSTWAAQQAREFDRTATSHIYRAAGTYYIDLSVEYGAEYRFAGGGWVPLVGTLTLPANRLKATAGSAQTLLFDENCRENPTGPGC